MSSGRIHSGKKDEKYAGVRNFFGDPEKTTAYNERKRKELEREAVPLYDRDCKLCGAPLHLAETYDHKEVALDLRSHIYSIVYEKTAPGMRSQIVRTKLSYVNHRYVCSKIERPWEKADAAPEAKGVGDVGSEK